MLFVKAFFATLGATLGIASALVVILIGTLVVGAILSLMKGNKE